MESAFGRFERSAAAYYAGKLQQHGATPAGVDWNSPESQNLRFEQLMKIAAGADDGFSLLDFGCGYGALWQALQDKGVRCKYTGYDVAPEMIAEAERLYGSDSYRRWTGDSASLAQADYIVASGIFNVKLDADERDWKRYILDTIDHMNRLSVRGFSFNMLTSYSDADKMRPNLYYGDPCYFFDNCKRKHSRHVALLHDYGLWEFTILVRK
jgi:SAM-dependent methyltransferase